jgi:hypothetical protein
VSATQSGIRQLPLILGVTVFSALAGVLTTLIGYYVPFVYFGTVLMTIGAGLLTTWEVNTSMSKWVGYQFLAGTGIGMTLQQPMIAAQAVFSAPEDIAVAASAVVFFQTLGGALFISVAQNVFTNKLVEGILSKIPDMDTATILRTGATQLKSVFPSNVLPIVIQAYNDAITQAFYASVAMGAFAFFAGLGLEWKNVKGKKLEAIGA